MTVTVIVTVMMTRMVAVTVIVTMTMIAEGHIERHSEGNRKVLIGVQINAMGTVVVIEALTAMMITEAVIVAVKVMTRHFHSKA